MTLKRILRYYYLKLSRLRGEPKDLARGMAVGTFIGVTPIIPFHTITVLLITFFTGTSTLTALLATIIVSNPLTFIPQYYCALFIGNLLTPYTINWQRIKSVLEILLQHPGFKESIDTLGSLGMEATVVLLVGGIVLAAPLSIASYFLSFHFFKKFAELRRKKHYIS